MALKELRVTKPDFENYFLMWDSVLFYPTPDAKSVLYGHAGGLGTIPCHQHRACKALVKCESRFPPRWCPHCKVDTAKEFQMLPEEVRTQWLQSL